MVAFDLQQEGRLSPVSTAGTEQQDDSVLLDEQQQGSTEAGTTEVPRNAMQTVNAITDLNFKFRISISVNTILILSRNMWMSIVIHLIGKISLNFLRRRLF